MANKEYRRRKRTQQRARQAERRANASTAEDMIGEKKIKRLVNSWVGIMKPDKWNIVGALICEKCGCTKYHIGSFVSLEENTKYVAYKCVQCGRIGGKYPLMDIQPEDVEGAKNDTDDNTNDVAVEAGRIEDLPNDETSENTSEDTE